MGREDVACYRLYAANCIELARHIVDPDRRVFLFRMAQAWTQLANQVEGHVRAQVHAEDSSAISGAQPEQPAGYTKGMAPQPK